MVQCKRSIEPEREYNLVEIYREKIFGNIKDIKTIKNIIQDDRKGENMLNVKIEGEGRLQRYIVRGGNIKKFLKKYGPGLSIRERK